MKFYLVWDKTNKEYVKTRKNSYRQTGNARIYATHRHAASAATLWTPDENGESYFLKDESGKTALDAEGKFLRNPKWRHYTDEENREKRKELFEIHEYEANEYKVVG